jgi:hypothetical protein
MPFYDALMQGGTILRLTVNEQSVDVNNNQSTLVWSLQLIKGSYSSWTSTPIGWSANIGGVGYSGAYTFDFRSESSHLIAQTTTVLNHDVNGDLHITVSGHTDYTGTSVGGPTDAVATFDGTHIARASSASFTNPMTIGQTYTITINRASTAYTHTVQWFFGNLSQTMAVNVATSVNWTPDPTLMQQIPNSTSGVGTIRIITYNGASQIGIRDFSVTLVAPATAVPSFTDITYSDSNSDVASKVGAFVKGMSQPAINIVGAAGYQGSTISSYKITMDGQTINGQSGTLGNALATAGSSPIVGTVTDSRGRTFSMTKTATVLDYAPPLIISSSTQRSDSSGTPSEEGTYVRVNINASASSLMVSGTEKNQLVYKISTRQRGGTVWTLQKTVTIASGVTFNGYDTISPYPLEQSFEILIEVSDKFNTSSIQSTIATGTIFMHWGNPGDGQGLGIGKFWETGRGAVDVLGQIYQNDGKMVFDTGDAAASSDITAGTATDKVLTPASFLTNKKAYADAVGIGATTAVHGTGTNVNISVTFPVGRFAVAPRVFGNSETSRITVAAAIATITTSGAVISLGNWSGGAASPYNFMWTARQMTPTSADG